MQHSGVQYACSSTHLYLNAALIPLPTVCMYVMQCKCLDVESAEFMSIEERLELMGWDR